jgi:hypothetical protein
MRPPPRRTGPDPRVRLAAESEGMEVPSRGGRQIRPGPRETSGGGPSPVRPLLRFPPSRPTRRIDPGPEGPAVRHPESRPRERPIVPVTVGRIGPRRENLEGGIPLPPARRDGPVLPGRAPAGLVPVAPTVPPGRRCLTRRSGVRAGIPRHADRNHVDPMGEIRRPRGMSGNRLPPRSFSWGFWGR